MKKKFTLLLSALMAVGLVYDYHYRMGHTNSSGANPNFTGDPAVNSGSTCGNGGCHTGGAGIPSGNEDSQITSDIPGTGYVPGQTYNITVSVAGGGSSFGFSLSTGSNLGDLIASGTTQLNGSGNFITHSAGNTSGSGSRSWDFQWTAPTAGSGDVTFYAATLYGNGSGSGGDVTIPISTTVQEASNVSITEAKLESLTVYPNPVIDEINVAAKDIDEEILITMFDVSGRQVLQELHEGGDVKIDVSSKSLNTGVYFFKIEAGGNSTIKKLLVK